MDLTSGDVEVRGHPTWVSDSGPGPAETVVLLHGGLSDSDALLDAIGGAIGAHHRIVAYDRRSHGRTADTDAPFHDDASAEPDPRASDRFPELFRETADS